MRTHVRHTGFILLLCTFLLCGCGETRKINAFIENDEIRLQVGSIVHFTYDPLTCQLSFNRGRKEFRAQTDNTSDFFAVTLSEIPCEYGQTVSADLVWTTPTDVLTRKNLTLEVIRIEGEKIWLWSSSGRIGLSICVLE